MRTESQIMKSIQDVYCSLSPENLSCDGELTLTETRKREKQFNLQLRILFIELGRHVSETEAMEYKEKE